MGAACYATRLHRAAQPGTRRNHGHGNQQTQGGGPPTHPLPYQARAARNVRLHQAWHGKAHHQQHQMTKRSGLTTDRPRFVASPGIPTRQVTAVRTPYTDQETGRTPHPALL
jgi:hypothetical protein